METQRDAVLQVLKLRGLPVSAAFPRRLAGVQRGLHRDAGAGRSWSAATRPTSCDVAVRQVWVKPEQS